MVNKTAALENAETSAVGRALAMMGIGVIESIASVDEINKAHGSQGVRQAKHRYATMKQVELMVNKVKWGLKTYDKDEIVNWLYKVVGKDLDKIEASEVDEALAKIDTALREDKTIGQLEKSTEQDAVYTDIPDEINLDKIAY
jgi:transcriptional regulator NrdR family protein